MRLRIWEFVLLILAVLSLTFLIVACTAGARAASREGHVTRIARPGVAFWGQPVDVEVRIEASGLPACPTAAEVAPIYAALVIDRSGSMAGQPLIEARNAASDFTDLMNLVEKGDAVTVIVFDDVANLLLGFSQDRGPAARAIQSFSEGGGTDIAVGLTMATQQFTAQPLPPTARRVIILLSDGQSDPAAAIAAADQAKSQGLRVVTIALGDADHETLAQIASTEADYYETSDPTALLDIYGEIAAGLVGTIATDATLSEFYDDVHFKLTGGFYRAQASGNQIAWRLPFVGQRGRSVGYFLEPQALGWYRVSPAAGQMSLTDCNGQPLSQATPIGPRVLVLFPIWLLYIAPALAALWLLCRLYQAWPRKPTERAGRPEIRPGDIIGPIKEKGSKPDGENITPDRPQKPPKR